MRAPPDDRSLAELLASLAESIPLLLRDEFELLKAQLAFAFGRLGSASALLVGATGFAIGTTLLLMAAVVAGLTMVFLWAGLASVPAVALASLASGAISALVTVLFIVAARAELRRAQLAMERSIEAAAGTSNQRAADDIR
jgi:hypothetical protein